MLRGAPIYNLAASISYWCNKSKPRRTKRINFYECTKAFGNFEKGGRGDGDDDGNSIVTPCCIEHVEYTTPVPVEPW